MERAWERKSLEKYSSSASALVKNQLQKGVWVPDAPQERLGVSGAQADIGFILIQIPPAVTSLCQGEVLVF